MTSAPQHIYAILRSQADWAAVIAGDPAAWFYDRTASFRVEADVLAARADINVWTEAGWNQPPRSYPALAIRVLRAPEPPRAPSVKKKRDLRKKPERPSSPCAKMLFRLPVEAPEQIDCLCEAYHMAPDDVVSRLIAEAYRRDVVESGLLAVLAGDEGIIAPTS